MDEFTIMVVLSGGDRLVRLDAFKGTLTKEEAIAKSEEEVGPIYGKVNKEIIIYTKRVSELT